MHDWYSLVPLVCHEVGSHQWLMREWSISGPEKGSFFWAVAVLMCLKSHFNHHKCLDCVEPFWLLCDSCKVWDHNYRAAEDGQIFFPFSCTEDLFRSAELYLNSCRFCCCCNILSAAKFIIHYLVPFLTSAPALPLTACRGFASKFMAEVWAWEGVFWI